MKKNVTAPICIPGFKGAIDFTVDQATELRDALEVEIDAVRAGREKPMSRDELKAYLFKWLPVFAPGDSVAWENQGHPHVGHVVLHVQKTSAPLIDGNPYRALPGNASDALADLLEKMPDLPRRPRAGSSKIWKTGHRLQNRVIVLGHRSGKGQKYYCLELDRIQLLSRATALRIFV